jgi:hypothetical protein
MTATGGCPFSSLARLCEAESSGGVELAFELARGLAIF